MANLRRTFTSGKMQLDADSRVLPPGEYREAYNILVTDSENSDSGTVQKSLSNKQLTNLNFGPNPITIFAYPHEFRDKIYVGVKSDTGCYIYEWDNNSQSATFVLQDTRSLANRVLNFNENFLCTGFDIVTSNEIDKEMILLTEDNMQPLCFNIERAKGYAINGFDKEDIYLIKKPPRFEPTIELTYTGGLENYIEEEFLTFSYRYKYLDGEYSALSGYTEYQFAPGAFKLDFLTLEQTGMTNQFNALRVGFNTGDKRVTDIQVVVKKSNSNALYIIETFNKEMEGWSDDQTQNFVFANNKRYTVLPERELYRSYDNVPIKAKSQTYIGNKVVYGNYVEGYNLLNALGQKVKPDYTLSIISNDLAGNAIPYTLNTPGNDEEGGHNIVLNLSGFGLNEGTSISLTLFMKSVHDEAGDPVVDGDFDAQFTFILNKDFANASELAQDADFILFVQTIMSNTFTAQYDIDPPADSIIDSETGFVIASYTTNTITITGPVIVYKIDNTPGDPMDDDFTYRTDNWNFYSQTIALFRNFAIASSLKTNRSYEVGIIYLDEFNRATTALTGKDNTIYIPQSLSTFQNKILVTLNNRPPTFADRYKFVVKQNTLSYQIIYGVLFYEDGPYFWVRLDGANKDKVKKDDILILKADLSGARTDLFRVPVIDVVDQEENFISGNVDPGNNEVIEERGLYMKIKQDNITADSSQALFFTYSNGGNSRQQIRFENIVSYLDTATSDYVDYPINPGSRITIYYFCDPAGTNAATPKVEFTNNYISNGQYDNLQDWFDAEVNGFGEFDDAMEVVFDRDVDDNGLNVNFRTKYSFIGNDLRAGLTVQLTGDVMIFETEPIQIDTEIFYETSQTFEIINDFHTGNTQNQTGLVPAIIELDFFNCYAMGNGAECYRVKDLITKNFLNIDLRPTSTSIEEYKQIRRFADLTYSEAYVESQSINGLNVFNLSTANYKELDKNGGSIQKLHSRDNDIVVLQEEEASIVLFDKTAIYSADGNAALTSIPGILGQQVPYQGNKGIGLNPESFAFDDEGRIFYASIRKGTNVRLSNDGVTSINYGTNDFWRDLFRNRPKSKKLGGYDPYHKHYVLSVSDEPVRLPVFQCGSVIIKNAITQPFSYQYILNNLGGDIVVGYTIVGNANISVTFNGNTTTVTNVTGSSNITIERDSLVENVVTVTVTPVSSSISYTLTNTCPLGTGLTIVSVVLNSDEDTGLTIVNRFKWAATSFYEYDDQFTAGPVTRFQTETGIEGQGKFPSNGDLTTIQSLKNSYNSGRFLLSECNRLGYLVSSTVYNTGTIDALTDAATFLTVSTVGEGSETEINSANFVFTRSNPNEILYLIYDYTQRQPLISDVTYAVELGGAVLIDVLSPSEASSGATVTIVTPPEHGTAVVDVDMNILYTQDGSENYEDSFTFQITDGGCSSIATAFLNVGVSCTEGITASGDLGIYEAIISVGTGIGWTGIKYNALSVPDSYSLYYDDVLVKTSKYVGDGLNPGPPVNYPSLLGPHTGLSKFIFDGADFVDSGATEDITVIQDDIADNVTYPINGNGNLLFFKPTALPTTVKVRVVAPVTSTSWGFDAICVVPADEIVDGTEMLVWGFFPEADKALKTRSIGVVKDALLDKFYVNLIGDDNFTEYSRTATNRFVNDGEFWYELSATGDILSSGAI